VRGVLSADIFVAFVLPFYCVDLQLASVACTVSRSVLLFSLTAASNLGESTLYVLILYIILFYACFFLLVLIHDTEFIL